MSVAFDTGILGVALDPDSKYPEAVDRVRDRVSHLVQTLASRNEQIIVPTPALSELLVVAREVETILEVLDGSLVFDVAPFDLPAAVEATGYASMAIKGGDKKAGAAGSWQRVKVDRQVVAIASVHGAEVLYSDDKDVRRLGAIAGVCVQGVADLPLPPDRPRLSVVPE